MISPIILDRIFQDIGLLTFVMSISAVGGVIVGYIDVHFTRKGIL